MRLFEQLTDALSSDKGDEQSWRWSIKTVASTSLEGGPDEGTDFSRASEVHQITAEGTFLAFKNAQYVLCRHEFPNKPRVP